MTDIRQRIRKHIAEEFMDGRISDLSDDTPLVDEEIIDSLGIFLLLGIIKERFGIEIEPEDVTLENFATVNAITALVEDKRPAA